MRTALIVIDMVPFFTETDPYTARDAATTGLRVLMVADANAARGDREHHAALSTIYRSFGDVRTTDEVLDFIKHCPN
ncbi:isochorismatase family protein [Streptomyces mexicanus]|jgi:nicotinamidase-related amidase|uniref:isochorismatase family protein n=1 Tax=Streptomyces mexicanus TaxID=178566 RepID=UPI0036B7FF83